jgi:REP element-mobilizing transposase RayT
MHVTVRIRRGLPRLRNFELGEVLHRAFVLGCNKTGFRICQFSVQGNHIHLVVEARDGEALARGMQGWSVRVARGINAELGRAGSVFDDRYHVEIIKTPRQVRNTLCYVLQNARRHGVKLDPRWNGIDPFSSAWWFDGWNDKRWREGLVPADEPPVAPAQSYLLTSGWRRHRLIGVTEVPTGVDH